MIKDLIVNLTPGVEHDPAAQYAVSIAAKFKAHAVGIVFAYDPAMMPTVMDGVTAGWIEAQRAENLTAAQHAVVAFEEAASRQGVSVEHRIIASSLGAAPGEFSRIARHFDLSVVGQSADDVAVPDDLLIEAALFETGRPTVVVPYIQKGDIKLGHVLVCWDHSRNAARAVADAMPLLACSDRVEVIMVTNKDDGDELPGTGIAQHLARHDLNVELKRLTSGNLDVSDVILSYAADCGADFIVMGGYGHSRLREFILGGATRGILRSMTVPVLMSH